LFTRQVSFKTGRIAHHAHEFARFPSPRKIGNCWV
jgi:hypothetical protein